MGKTRTSDTAGQIQKKSKTQSDHEATLLDKNKYAPLAKDGADIEKVVKVPPIFTASKDLAGLMRMFAPHKLNLQYKLCATGTKIICSNLKQFESAKELLKQQKQDFYSHDVASTKPMKVVIRGLPALEPQVVLDELKKHKLQPVAVYPMSRHNKEIAFRDTLYLVHLVKGSTTMANLKTIKALDNIIVSWEQYRPQHREVTQCSKCQAFGHGARNCSMKIKCPKCAGPHCVDDCLTMEEEKRVCANCSGDHQAAHKECPARAEFLKIRQKATARNPTRAKERLPPAVSEEQFPSLPRWNIPNLIPLPLNNRQHASATPWTAPATVSAAPAAPPPGFRSYAQAVQDGPVPPGLTGMLSAAELIPMFEELVKRMLGCHSLPDQIITLGVFVIEMTYGRTK